MYRVYFDGNDRADKERYGLWLGRSIQDLAKIPGGPREGMRVIIYMIGEIEMDAVLEWDKALNVWTARWIHGTSRPNHETWDRSGPPP